VIRCVGHGLAIGELCRGVRIQEPGVRRRKKVTEKQADFFCSKSWILHSMS
jgi:hypothetical protein